MNRFNRRVVYAICPISNIHEVFTTMTHNEAFKEKRFLTVEKLQDPQWLKRSYETYEYEYYLGDSNSIELFIEAAQKGFTIFPFPSEKGAKRLMPMLLKETILLEHADLHISKKVHALMAKKRYKLVMNKYFDAIAAHIQASYQDCFFDKYFIGLLRVLRIISPKGFQFITAALMDKETGEMVAGELGYIVNNYYVGISKFSKKDKEHQNLGTLQRVLLTQYLSKRLKIDLSDLGPATGYEYKLALGAKEYTREAFLKRVGSYQG